MFSNLLGITVPSFSILSINYTLGYNFPIYVSVNIDTHIGSTNMCVYYATSHKLTICHLYFRGEQRGRIGSDSQD